MPSNEARAAFNEAQRIAVHMQDKHSQEEGLVVALEQITDEGDRRAIERELAHVRHEWLEMSHAYTDAVGRFTAAVEAARQKRPNT
jgi:hypothetical protein